MTERVGQQLGNYTLIRRLGEGGFAEVYLGEHIHLGTQAAIKILLTLLSSDNVDEFRTEARTIARLVHPNIVRVNAVAWSPNGRYNASGSVDRTVQVWTKDSGEHESIRYDGHDDTVFAVAWSPNGRYIASGSDVNTAQIWQVEEPTVHNVITYDGHSAAVGALVWSPDGRYIVSGSDDGTVQIWESTTGRKINTYT